METDKTKGLKKDLKKVDKKGTSAFVTTKTVEIIDWRKVPTGTYFTARINGFECIGRIQKEGNRIFLCQNKTSGSNCKDKLKMRYSYEHGFHDKVNGEITNPNSTTVHNTIKLFVVQPKGFKENDIITINSHTVLFNKDVIKVGCNTISHSLLQQVVDRVNKTKKIIK